MKPIQCIIEDLTFVHAVKDHCTFHDPCRNGQLLRRCKSHGVAKNHWDKNRFRFIFQLAHPAAITLSSTDILDLNGRINCDPAPKITFTEATSTHGNFLVGTFFQEFQQPLRPRIFFRVDAATTEDALFYHRGSDCGEETENTE